MPIFDFVCEKCSTRVNDVMLRTDHTPKQYPSCETCGAPMEKQYGRTAAHFKGAGSHRVDYNAPTRGY